MLDDYPVAGANLSLFNRAVMTSPLTVAPKVTLAEAIARMHEAKSSYALVVEKNCPVGIFTERDIVRAVASASEATPDASHIEIAAAMTTDIALIIASEVRSASKIFARMHQQKVRHLTVVDSNGHLIGIITKQSLRQTLTTSALLKFRSVSEVMGTQPVCLSQRASVTQVARQMAAHDISCVVITNTENKPVGIITERDIVQFRALDLDICNTRAEQVMSTPLLPVNLADSLWQANQKMNQYRVRRLVVCTPERNLAGLITQSSVLQGLGTAEGQQVIELLQQEIMQLRSENEVLLEERNRKLECSQANLNNQLETTKIGQQQAEKELAITYNELEKSHNALTEMNESLNQTLQELQSAQQALHQANVELENRVEKRTSELRQAERRWRNLLEKVHLVVIGLDCDGKVNYANPFFLQLTGYSADEVLEKYWFKDFVSPDDYHHTHQYFQEFISDGDLPLRYQNAIKTRTGTERTIVWNNVVLRDHTETIIGTMSIGEDITERLAVDRIKAEFISVVSHELRTPLTAIHGGLRMITGDLVPCDSTQGQQLLKVAAESSYRLVRLVNDILELERLESGKLLLRKTGLNTRSLTAHIADTFHATTQDKGITLNISDPGFTVLADHDRLIQVLTNLLDNAIKFSPENGTIWLSVEKNKEIPHERRATALFTVRDQGRGIPAEDLSDIFKRFTQVNASDSREQGGTGLGLAICHNIVGQHGGKIWAGSTLGKGSCFQFTVPLG